jgi:cation transport ATPase
VEGRFVILHFVGILIQKIYFWLVFFEKSVKVVAAITKVFLLCVITLSHALGMSHMTVQSLMA